MPSAPLFMRRTLDLDGTISAIHLYILYIHIVSIIVFRIVCVSCSPANLPVPPAAESLVLYRRRSVLPPPPARAATHATHQRQLRRGAKLLSTAVSGAVDASTDATATAGATVSAAVALQPQLPAAVAGFAASTSCLGLVRTPTACRLLCHLYAATHTEQHCVRVHLQLGGISLVWAAQPRPRPGIDAHGASRSQDAPAAQPVRCGQTVSTRIYSSFPPFLT